MYISTSSTSSLTLQDLLGANCCRSQVPAPWFIGTCFALWQSPCLSLSPSDPCWFSPSKGSGTTSFERLKFKFYGEDKNFIPFLPLFIILLLLNEYDFLRLYTFWIHILRFRFHQQYRKLLLSQWNRPREEKTTSPVRQLLL